MSKKILVTGGAGFIGSNLVDELCTTNDEILVLDNLSTGSRTNIQHHLDSGRIRFIEADLRDPAAVARATRGVDLVYHLAVQCVRVSLHDPRLVHEVNATGTLNLCMAALQNEVGKIVYTSSAEVYGDGKSIPMDESHPLMSSTPYGAAKLCGELYLGVYRRTYGLPSVALRLFNTYGPREHFEGLYGEVIPRFALRILNGKPPIIFGDGRQTRSFHEVSDTVRAIRLAAETPEAEGEVFNIGGEEEITIQRLAETLIALLNPEGDMKPLHAEARPGEILRHAANMGKARSILGFFPKYDLESGLRRYIEWLRRGEAPSEQTLSQILFDWRAA